MCRCSDMLLNCVSTYIERSPEFRQLLIGISTMRYLPPSGTAGFARSFVNGNKRVPAPPPMTMASVRWVVSGGNAPNTRGFFGSESLFGWCRIGDQSIVNGFGVNNPCDHVINDEARMTKPERMTKSE